MGTTSIVETLNCACNPKKPFYASRNSYTLHLNTDRHRAWELEYENKSLRERLSRLENENAQLKNKVLEKDIMITTILKETIHHRQQAKCQLYKLD